jgi:hypothetical protein
MPARASIFAVASTAAVLSACATVPLTSLPALSRIDPETTEIGAIRVALDLPAGLRTRPGGAMMEAVAKVSGMPDRTVFYRLQEVDAGPAAHVEGHPVPTGFRRFVYRLAPTEVQGLEALRRDVFQHRATGRRASLGFGIKTREFCQDGALHEGDVLATTYLRTSETRGFVVVTRRLNLRQQPDIAAELSDLKTC